MNLFEVFMEELSVFCPVTGKLPSIWIRPYPSLSLSLNQGALPFRLRLRGLRGRLPVPGRRSRQRALEHGQGNGRSERRGGGIGREKLLPRSRGKGFSFSDWQFGLGEASRYDVRIGGGGRSWKRGRSKGGWVNFYYKSLQNADKGRRGQKIQLMDAPLRKCTARNLFYLSSFSVIVCLLHLDEMKS